MEISAQTLADLLGGEIVGDPATVVTGPARIEQARRGDVCFLANPKYEHYIYDTKASVLLINKSFVPKQPIPATLIKVDDAYSSVSVLLDFFSRMKHRQKRGNGLWARLSLKRSIARTARIGQATYLYPQVYVGDHVTEENVKAKFEDGVLRLEFPKEETIKLPEKKTIMIE